MTKMIPPGTPRSWLAAGMIALMLGLAGCGKEAPKAGEAQPLNVGTLKIAALSNLYAAEKLGYFKEEGLAVTFTEMGGGAELLPAVSAGKIDITLSIPSVAIQAIDKGFDFKMVLQNEVAAKQGPDSQAVFVNADSGMTDLAQLKGKTAATNNIRSQMWLSFVEVLNKKGVGDNDVSIIELPFPNMEDALRNKQVAAVLNVEPFTSRMASNPAFKVISYAATEALPGQPLGAFWASKKWLDTHGDTVEKFVRAVQKSNVYLSSHPDETLQIIAEYTGMNIDAIKKMKPILWDAKVDKATVQSLITLMKAHGLIQSQLDADTVLFHTATD